MKNSINKISIEVKIIYLFIFIGLLLTTNYFLNDYREHVAEDFIIHTRLLDKTLAQTSHFPLYINLIFSEQDSSQYNDEIIVEFNNRIIEIRSILASLRNGGVYRFDDQVFRVNEIEGLEAIETITRLNIILRKYHEQVNLLQKSGQHNMSGEMNDHQGMLNSLIAARGTMQSDLLVKSNTIIDYLEQIKMQEVIYNESQQKSMKSFSMFLILIILISIILGIYIVKRMIYSPLKKILAVTGELANGDVRNMLTHNSNGFIRELSGYLNKVIVNIKNASAFAQKIGDGKFDTTFKASGAEDVLGNSLEKMRDKLNSISIEESRRNWATEGLAKFADILRKNNDNIEQLSDDILMNLIKYLKANQGGLFIINEEDKDDVHLVMVACYAYERKKHVSNRINKGEGLAGRCWQENDTIYVDDVPDNYINITSGLGDANPRSILIVPLKINDAIFGVIEIASFNTYHEHEIVFVEKLAESIASTISTVKVNEKTQRLLQESQEAAEQLKAQEEELKQNAEEMHASQEELSRKLSEQEKESTYTKCIVEAINQTNASIELDMKGNIIEVNDMYLSVMGYDREELIGKNESFMVPEDERNSDRYKMMWKSIEDGSHHAGEYRRIDKWGNEVWLNGAYNPIFDVDGKPYKIIQLAQFTTEEKEKTLDLNNRLAVLNDLFVIAEVKTDGCIKSVNKLLLEKFGYKRKELRNNEFKMLLDPDDPNIEIYNKLLENVVQGDPHSETLKYITNSGEKISFNTTFSPMKNLSGEISKIEVLLINSINHISQEKEAELQ